MLNPHRKAAYDAKRAAAKRQPELMLKPTPICPYCQKPSEKCTGKEVYPHMRDLWKKVMFRCVPCKAWVGCHPGSEVPLGRLADAQLRKAKGAAHKAFDDLWHRKMERDGVSQGTARAAAYIWLGEQMGIKPEACHIGMFDGAQCDQVVALCRPWASLRKERNR